MDSLFRQGIPIFCKHLQNHTGLPPDGFLFSFPDATFCCKNCSGFGEAYLFIGISVIIPEKGKIREIP